MTNNLRLSEFRVFFVLSGLLQRVFLTLCIAEYEILHLVKYEICEFAIEREACHLSGSCKRKNEVHTHSAKISKYTVLQSQTFRLIFHKINCDGHNVLFQMFSLRSLSKIDMSPQTHVEISVNFTTKKIAIYAN